MTSPAHTDAGSRPSLEHLGAAISPRRWWLAALAWSLAAAALALRALDAAEGATLAQPPAALAAASPLGALAVRAVAALGPPAEVAFRLLGLLGLPLGALAGARLLEDESRPTPAITLAAITLATHGPLITGATDLTPLGLLWTCESLLLLVTLAPSRGRLPVLALATAGAVGLEPLALALVVPLVHRLARQHREAALTMAITALTTLVAGGIAGLELPRLRAPELTDLAVLGGLPPTAEASSFVEATALTAALALAGLGLLGLRRLPTSLLWIVLGLLVQATAILTLRGEASWSAGRAWLLVPPVLLLASARLPDLPRGPDRALWAALLLSVSLGTGVHTVATAERPATRAVAAALEPDERLLVADSGLAAAVSFYRDQTPGEEAEKVARLWAPGDREPRKVAVHAFGQKVGNLWIVRPGELVFDLGGELPEAHVTIEERDERRRCQWQVGQGRFSCGGPEYLQVAWAYSSFNGIELDALLTHPIDDGLLELCWQDIPLGRQLIGVAGLDDSGADRNRSPVEIEVLIDGRSTARLSRGQQRGLLPFELELDGPPRRGSICFRLTTEVPRGRELFLDAVTVR